MKNLMNKKLFSLIGIIGLSVLPAKIVQASSAFNSSATITYNIDSILNTTSNSSDVTGLSISGGFGLDTFSSYIGVSAPGDGSATLFSAITDAFVDPVLGSFGKTFNVSGNVNDGSVDAFYLGLFDLNFVNESSDTFQIQITLNYDLSAVTNGQFAESTVQLDFFDDLGDFDSGIAGYSVYATTPFAPDQLQGSAVYTFNLEGFGTNGIYADVGISSYAEASPVPLPGAFGLFASALIIPFFKRKSHS
jgi:hypothetical protein